MALEVFAFGYPKVRCKLPDTFDFEYTEDELAGLVDKDSGVPWYDGGYRDKIDHKVRKEGYRYADADMGIPPEGKI